MENTMTMSKSYEQKMLERRRELFEQAPGEEAVEKRSESVKHFRLGAGRYQAVVFPEPVHYQKDGDGWTDIDNNLEDATDDSGRAVLRNRANSLRVELSKSADSGKLARIESDGRVLEWSLDGMPTAAAPVVRQGAQIKQARLVARAQATPLFVGRTRASLEKADLSVLETEAEKRADLTATMDSDAIYENVLPGLSVRYTLHGQTLKEDLILANAAALPHAALRLPDTYDYEAMDDGSVSVRDKVTGECYYVFEAPYVYDAENAEIPATVVLTPVSDGVRMHYALDGEALAQAAFPVTIDPLIRSANANKYTEFTCLADGQSLPYSQAQDHIKTGAYNGKQCVGMLRFLSLAPLEASDTVIQAQLCMYSKNRSTSNYIGVYSVNSDWNKANVAWTNFDPHDESKMGQDAIECQKGPTASYIPIQFDITNLYRKWCMTDESGNSQNFGVAFHSPRNVVGTNYTELYASNAAADRQPVLYLYYVSHAGIESWWQYESRSAGRAGTVYADLFNGNMVLAHSDTTMAGNLMPVSVSHYYNSCLSDANDYACGKGWKTSAHQKVTREEHNELNYFVWEDGDGTQHYFKDEGAQPFKDEEGMDLELYLYDSDGYIVISDKKHNRMRFDIRESGLAWLVAVRDALSNEVTYEYVSGYEKQGRISKITDPAGRETVFTYSNNLLSDISIPDTEEGSLRHVYFTYDSNQRLTGIRYSELGGTSPHTVYTYDGSTAILTRAKNYDGVCVDVGYEAKSRYNSAALADGANDQMRRVLSLETLHVNDSGAVTKRGTKQLFDYQHMCTVVTAVKDTASDAGKKLYYQFNDSGNVVAMRDELGYGQFVKFEAGVDNKPSEVSKLRKVVINQLRKIDFSSQWTGGGSAVKDSSTRCLGMPSVKLTGNTNGESYYQQSVTLLPGQTYTLSAYIKAEDVQGGNGAFLRLVSADGWTQVDSEPVTGSTPAAAGNEMPADGWQRIKLTYGHASNEEETFTVRLMLDATAGTAWFSCPQLETGTVANSVNLLSNADFHLSSVSGAQTLPTDWGLSSNDLTTAPTSVFPASDDPDFPAALEGNYMQIEGRPDKVEYVGFGQELDIQGKKNDVLVCGGWASAHSVPNATEPERSFAIIVRLQNTSGQWSNHALRPFNSEWVGWQYASHGLVVPVDFIKIGFVVVYTGNCNYAKFSNLFLYRESFGVSFGYSGTDRRNVTSTTNLAGMEAHMEYDSADNLYRWVQPGRENVEANKYLAWYGDTDTQRAKHLLLRERTPEKVVNYHDYNNHGSRTSSRCVDYRVTTNNTAETAYPYIRTEQTYTADGNFALDAKDARGNTVTRSTNTRTGELNSVTDPTGQTINYTYDDAKRVTGVETTGDGKTYRNAYTYEEDRIKTASHNTTDDMVADVTYTFDYDDLGRKTTVKVGTQTLSTNVYENDRNGLLQEVQYGNGGKVKYTYDEFDRITGLRYDGETSDRYTYEYGANGMAARVHDNNLDRIYETEYDLSDRPCRGTLYGEYGDMLYRTTLEYTRHSNLASFHEEVGTTWLGATHETSYTYDVDNRVTQMQFDDSLHKIAYTYDELGRIKTRALTNGSSAYTTTYTFVAGGYGTNSTTSLVAGISQGTGSNAMNFAYAYDSRGYITSETRNGAVTTYTYDALGQLIRVNDPNDTTAGESGTTWLYNYDRGGNITSKSYYAYTTGTPGTVMDTITYSYTDSNWKDKLTAYDGQTITYDAIGNPLNDGTWTYTWEKGRQLKQMSKAGMTVEFAYDHNGLRTQKKVTSGNTVTTTEYILHGKLITHLTMGSDEMHFFYDAQSRPAMVSFNGALYSYVHNLQGDIVGILDSNGSLVVEYKYDAWGKPVLVRTLTTAYEALAELNPFRYRGYVWDEEIRLYYLRTRYYCPNICRFVNGDIIVGIKGRLGSHNGYAYSYNLPVILGDPMGMFAGIAALGVIIGVTTAIIAAVTVGTVVIAAVGKTFSDEGVPKTINPFEETGDFDNRDYSLNFVINRTYTVSEALAQEQNIKYQGYEEWLNIFNNMIYDIGTTLITLPLSNPLVSLAACCGVDLLITGYSDVEFGEVAPGDYTVRVAVYSLQTVEGTKYFIGRQIDGPTGSPLVESWNYFPFEASEVTIKTAWDMAILTTLL